MIFNCPTYDSLYLKTNSFLILNCDMVNPRTFQCSEENLLGEPKECFNKLKINSGS